MQSKRIIERHEAGEQPVPPKAERAHNYDGVRELVTGRVKGTRGRISAKRLLPEAVAAGYTGSARNFRRLVRKAKNAWRAEQARGRRPVVWTPGETLVIDWGSEGGLHVFCAVLAWSRFRFVRFADNERATTTLSMLAECFEELGGVPRVVLSDRMGCLKGGVAAGVVVPTVDYVRFATHYAFRPDFCEGADPESKGIVERLVGYAKSDLLVPQGLSAADLNTANEAARAWCVEVNGVVHAEIVAVPAERLVTEREVLRPLPSLRPPIGKAVVRKVDKLSCIRIGSARYSVPNRLVGRSLEVLAGGSRVKILEADVIVADHLAVLPGEVSLVDDHYGGARPPVPRRTLKPRTVAEKAFCALGPVAEAFIKGAAAAGATKLPGEIADLAALEAAHGKDVLVAALERAVAFGRFRAADVRSILAAGAGTPTPTRAGDALILELPVAPTRDLAEYNTEELA